MPPKRKSAASSGPASKKSKQAAAAAPPPAEPAEEYEPPRSKRWSELSGSANAEGHYRMVWKDEEKAYSYITLCSASYIRSKLEDDDYDDDEGEDSETEEGDEEEEDEADDDEERLGQRCSKKKCVCFKPLASSPEHPWVISWAGFRKFNNQFTQTNLRDPDNFGMYTFNDHAAYGSLEVLQNLFLDFEEAGKEKRGGWREQWAVCECIVHWLLHDMGQIFIQSDDGEGVHDAVRLVGRLFLAMLAQLDGLSLVGDATAVKSLGCTMAMYMVLAHDMRKCNAIDDSPRKPYGSAGKFQPDYFEDAVLAYANKRGVTLRGPANIEEIIADAVGDVALPARNAADPWGFKAGLRTYKSRYAGSLLSPMGPKSIGGDKYDITAMSPRERKEAAFDGKDPLNKKTIDALKKGMVMHMQ
ncbi:hypothetical protein GGR51DRAFT_508660 [Nemania sp. FL0031]|nr:hypothetical protein GGR51DRAFT_508660 [Nemania sp. FL0031]